MTTLPSGLSLRNLDAAMAESRRRYPFTVRAFTPDEWVEIEREYRDFVLLTEGQAMLEHRRLVAGLLRAREQQVTKDELPTTDSISGQMSSIPRPSTIGSSIMQAFAYSSGHSKLGGWRTRSMLTRYNIVDSSDLAAAQAKMDAAFAAAAPRKVVPLRKVEASRGPPSAPIRPATQGASGPRATPALRAFSAT